MAVYVIPLEVEFGLSVKNNITEQQIRAFLSNYQPQAESYLQGLIAAAPSAAETVYVGATFEYEHFEQIQPGEWWIAFTISPTIEAADHVLETEVWDYLKGYYTETKTMLRALVAAAPNNTKAKIVRWHIHRGRAGSFSEIEP